MWGKLAEIAQQYLKKGQLVFIEGRLQTRQWDDKRDGSKRTTTEIVANTMKMLGGRGEGAAAGAGTGAGMGAPARPHEEFEQAPPPEESQAPGPGPEISDEDIPF